MSAEPSGYPQWDESDVNTTEATTEKTSGWSPAALPSVEHANWFQRLVYLWIKFLNLVRFRWSDIGPDWHVPQATTLPATGAGLVGTSGAQVAYVQGRRVDGVSEAHTYAASTDTYIDLSRDAGWVFSQVANGAGAPAVAANSIRCFKMVTDGSDRVSVTSFVGEQVKTSKPWRFGKGIELGGDLLIDAAGAAIARVIAKYWDDGLHYTLLRETAPSSGAVTRTTWRHYVYSFGGEVLTSNARWDPAAEEWVVDSATVGVSHKLHISADGVVTFQSYTGAGPFDDSSWETEELQLGSTLKLGVNLDTEALHLVPRIFAAVVDSGTGERTFLLETAASGRRCRWYLSAAGTAAFGHCLEITENCSWNGSAWARDAAGIATKTEIGAGGVRVLTFDATSIATWGDGIPSWVRRHELAAGGDATIAGAYKHTTRKTYIHTFTGADGAVDDPARWARASGSTPQASGPTLTKNNGGSAGVTWSLRLPQGARIDSAKWYGTCDAGTGEVRAAIARQAKADGANAQIAKNAAADAYDTFASSGSYAARSLTVDNADGPRTVDNAAYTYRFWFHGTGDSVPSIYMLEVGYSVLEVSGA